jgi:hypothetical protein
MTGIADRLIHHLEILNSGDISLSTTQRLMALLREFLEERKERSQYPLLVMFCDWALHNRLDRSSGGGRLLDLLDETWANSHQVDAQIQHLVSQLSPAMLRGQLIELLRKSLIWPAAIQNDEYFTRLVKHLIADLAGKPISRGAKEQSKRTADRIGRGLRFIAERILFEKVEERMQLVLVARQIEPASGGEVRIQIPWGV